MKKAVDFSGLDQAIAGLDARMTALAAAVVRSAAVNLGEEAEHLFGEDVRVDVSTNGSSAQVHIAGTQPVLREFGSHRIPAQPWVTGALDRTANKLTRRGAR